MLLVIILLPLFGFLTAILFGRFLGKGVSFLTTFFIFLSFLLSFFLFLNITKRGGLLKVILGSWLCVDTLDVQWSFCFDSLTSTMLVVITFISTLVHLYSTEYMKDDAHILRFMSYLSLFTFFMLMLVTANNFLQMFVGWEGVGLSSYLLINFWFTRIQANKSAIKAMLVNRVGDFFILLSMFLLFLVYNSLDYDVIFNISNLIVSHKFNFGVFELPCIDLICIFLFLGSMGKSAQIGLHVWLPDAMEGPTPVSALIHAATMVTAGVFLIARCSFLFEHSPLSLNIIILIGSLTAFFASTTGVFQNDLKKVIAYSTCSQLGYMIFACGLSSYEVGVFHLFNHAFFKALLFLGAGAVIHGVSNEQDMRKMGGLKNLLPLSYAVTIIGSLALVGFPFLSGFYSKDTILEIAFSKHTFLSHFSFYLGSFAAFFTSFYSTRLLFLVFLSNPNGNKNTIGGAHEGSWGLSLPLLLLALMSIFVGFLTKDLFIGFGTNFWAASIFVSAQNYTLSDIEFLNIFFKQIPLILTIFGISTALYLYIYNINSFFSLKQLKFFWIVYIFFNKKWFFDKLYNTIISKNFLYWSYHLTYKNIDRGVFEVWGPFGLTKMLREITIYLEHGHSGNLSHYLFLTSFAVFLSFFIYSQV